MRDLANVEFSEPTYSGAERFLVRHRIWVYVALMTLVVLLITVDRSTSRRGNGVTYASRPSGAAASNDPPLVLPDR